MSQLETAEEMIGDHKYTMYMLAPIRSHNLLIDVGKMVGPAFGALIGSIMPSGKAEEPEEEPTDSEEGSEEEEPKEDSGDLSERQVDSELLASAVALLFTGLNKKTLEQVIHAFKEVTEVDGKLFGKGTNFDQHFRGELGNMYKWLAFGMNVQWGKSLSVLASGASGPGAQALRGLLKSQST